MTEEELEEELEESIKRLGKENLNLFNVNLEEYRPYENLYEMLVDKGELTVTDKEKRNGYCEKIPIFHFVEKETAEIFYTNGYHPDDTITLSPELKRYTLKELFEQFIFLTGKVVGVKK